VKGDRVFTAAGSAGFAIYHWQGSGCLTGRGALSGFGSAQDVIQSNGLLYLGDSGPGSYYDQFPYGGLAIAKLDPSRPAEVFAYDTFSNAVSVDVDGDWVYLADQAGGLLVFRKIVSQAHQTFFTYAD
jgi:hypothetical protein